MNEVKHFVESQQRSFFVPNISYSGVKAIKQMPILPEFTVRYRYFDYSGKELEGKNIPESEKENVSNWTYLTGGRIFKTVEEYSEICENSEVLNDFRQKLADGKIQGIFVSKWGNPFELYPGDIVLLDE